MKFTRAAVAALTILITGCASLGGGTPATQRSPADPFEPVNRAVDGFNGFLDTMFLKPAARAYVKVTPDIIKAGVGNFFGNIGDGYSLFNDALQGKSNKFGDDLRRVFVNTTFGIGGIFDLATPLGYEKGDEDFGQTLGYWGFKSGPYLVLPLLGPSSVRDAAGLLPSLAFDPVSKLVSSVSANNALRAVRAIDARAGLLPSEALLNSAALDKYTFLRSAYLQRRQSLVYDGKPPIDD